MKQNVVTEQTERVRALETRLQEQLALLSEGDSSALAAAVAKQRLLQLEVDRLTRDLQAARNERERQRSHVEEGKAIAVSLQEELTKLQQEHGSNPLGGCMPMLLTMLVLFGFLGVVYYPVHYIFGVSNEAVKAACEAIGLATTNTSTMQTALIQAIHNGASIDPSIISAGVVAEIQNFNTSFFGMDMCDVPGFHLTPIAIFPAIATVTMFVSYFITQKLSGMDAQMQGSMKVMMLVMNLMFVTFCFNAPVGFSLYYGTSNIFMMLQTVLTYKVYNPEKFKAQYEAEVAAKRAAKKEVKTVTVEEGGKKVEKNVNKRQLDQMRLEYARKLDAEKYANDRTVPLTDEQRAEMEAQKAQKGKKKK